MCNGKNWGNVGSNGQINTTSTPKPARQDLDDYEEQYLAKQGQRLVQNRQRQDKHLHLVAIVELD